MAVKEDIVNMNERGHQKGVRNKLFGVAAYAELAEGLHAHLVFCFSCNTTYHHAISATKRLNKPSGEYYGGSGRSTAWSLSSGTTTGTLRICRGLSGRACLSHQLRCVEGSLYDTRNMPSKCARHLPGSRVCNILALSCRRPTMSGRRPISQRR